MSQRVYALVLIKHVGLDQNNTITNKFYIPVHKTNNWLLPKY